MVPNQKMVRVNKEMCDKDHPYVMININAMSMAAKDLTPTQFQVWIYFAKNQKGYTFELSRAAVMDFCGIKSEKTYKDAIKTLVAKRYLVKEYGYKYDFYEIPKEEDDVEMLEDGTVIECHTTTQLA